MKKLISAILALLLLTTAALAETELTVQGSGVVKVMADQARVLLGVREANADVMTAQKTVNEKINAICDALLAAGIDTKDIATEEISIYANYDYSGETEKIVGYTATNMLAVTVTDMDKAGEIIDIAFEAGANMLQNIDFSAKDTQEAQREALKLAVQNATEKAAVIAEAAGMTVKGIERIDEGESYGYVNAGAKYSNLREEAVMAADGARVQASDLQVTATVTVVFELKEAEN